MGAAFQLYVHVKSACKLHVRTGIAYKYALYIYYGYSYLFWFVGTSRIFMFAIIYMCLFTKQIK